MVQIDGDNNWPDDHISSLRVRSDQKDALIASSLLIELHSLGVEATSAETSSMRNRSMQTFAAYDVRSTSLPWIKVEPKFEPLRTEPRFQELLHRLNL